jgi:hemerythrin
MAIVWRKEFETGNLTVDKEHKSLVLMFNRFINACMSDKSDAELEGMLKFLCNYTVQHFTDEEVWQKQINYPRYQRHKEIHEAFKLKATQLYTRFIREGSSSSIVIQLNKDIGEWLINHILFEDLQIAAYVKAVKQTGGMTHLPSVCKAR